MTNKMPNEIWACNMAVTNEPYWWDKESCDGSTTPYIRRVITKEEAREAIEDIQEQPLEPWEADDSTTYVQYVCIDLKTHKTIRKLLEAHGGGE